MSELTFLQTGYLASLLLASLVLPVLFCTLAPMGKVRQTSVRLVWTGQLTLSAAGLILRFSPSLALFAAVFGVIVVMICASAMVCLRNTPARVKI